MLGTLSAVVGIASQVAGLFGKKNRQPTLNLRKLRNDAINNGFHPLTVLQATGGQGFHTGGGPNKLATFAESAAGMADVLQNYASFKTAQEESDARIRLIDAETKAAEGRISAGKAPTAFVPLSAENRALDQVTPQFQTWNDVPYIRVYNVDGTSFQVKKLVADRLQLKEGDVWIAEDTEAVWGDIVGELASLGVLGSAAWSTLNGADPIFKGIGPHKRAENPHPPLETPRTGNVLTDFVNTWKDAAFDRAMRKNRNEFRKTLKTGGKLLP